MRTHHGRVSPLAWCRDRRRPVEPRRPGDAGLGLRPDGVKLASTSWCDGVRIWALDIDDLLEIARREAGRSLTDEEFRQYLHVDECSRA